MTVGPLDTDQTVADAGGVATLSFGPGAAFQRWDVARVSVVAAGDLEPACVITKGSTNGYRLAATDAGASDDADFNPPIGLMPGDRITVTWTGVTAGAAVSATVWGEAGRA